jgi:steroid delta-isomerase-like uncharacterized protein
MSEAANKELAEHWFDEVWNKGRESAIDELFHSEGKAHGLPTPDSFVVGPEGFKTIHRQFHSAFSNIHIVIEDLVAEGDKVAIRWTSIMTHTGDGLGFPATGKKAILGGASIMHVREGKIIEGWNFMDMTQITQYLQAK